MGAERTGSEDQRRLKHRRGVTLTENMTELSAETETVSVLSSRGVFRQHTTADTQTEGSSSEVLGSVFSDSAQQGALQQTAERSDREEGAATLSCSHS